MALTLANAQQLSQSKLVQTVIDEFRQSPLLDKLPFDNTVKPQGKSLAYVYNRVTTLPTAAARAINADYTPQEAVTTQITANLKIFGGSYQIDRALRANEEQVVDLVMFEQDQKIKATKAMFHDMFINGDSAIGDGTQFDGLDKILTGSSTEIDPGAIALDSAANIKLNWEAFLYQFRKMRAVMDGAPTLYLMNSDMFAAMQVVLDLAGQNTSTKENYGSEVLQWGPSLLMALGDRAGSSNPVIATNGATGETDIFAVRLGMDGIHGISPEGNGIVNTYLPDFTRVEAVQTGAVEMIAAIALKATRAAAVLRSIKIA
ncbi:MAG: major capsid protein [Clostridiaceae bacterium]